MKENKIVATLWRWVKRAFWGAGKEISEDDKFVVEKIESPSTMAVKAFFRRKLAVGALVVLISMFLFVFIGPYFFPMNLNYTDALQANMAPNNTLMKVPNELENNIKNINGFADFTVGVSKDDTLYLWGNTKNNLTNVDYAAFPEEVQPGNVAHAAAGSDHSPVPGCLRRSRKERQDHSGRDHLPVRQLHPGLVDRVREEL